MSFSWRLVSSLVLWSAEPSDLGRLTTQVSPTFFRKCSLLRWPWRNWATTTISIRWLEQKESRTNNVQLKDINWDDSANPHLTLHQSTCVHPMGPSKE